MYCATLGFRLPTPHGNVDVARIGIYSGTNTTRFFRGHQCRAGPEQGVEDQSAVSRGIPNGICD
jgi:hypothetical protein